jgi:carbon storage regulator
MLVLTRKLGETIHINGSIKITVLKASSGRIRMGIDAPDEYRIVRGELDQWSELVPAIRPSTTNMDRHLSPC